MVQVQTNSSVGLTLVKRAVGQSDPRVVLVVNRNTTVKVNGHQVP